MDCVSKVIMSQLTAQLIMSHERGEDTNEAKAIREDASIAIYLLMPIFTARLGAFS